MTSLHTKSQGGASGRPNTKTTRRPTPPPDVGTALLSNPAFSTFGPLFKSSSALELTEAETEYVVTCIKHTFARHMVLQFDVLNTVAEQVLQQVTVEMERDDGDDTWQTVASHPLETAVYGVKASCFVVVEKVLEDHEPLPVVTMALELKFKVCELDPVTGQVDGEGFDEDYPLEDLELSSSDFIAPVPVPDFASAWKALNENEVRESFALPGKDLGENLASVLRFLGMAACDGTEVIQPRATSHIFSASGLYIGGIHALVKGKLAHGENGIILQMAVRSQDADVSQTLSDCIR